MNALSKLAVKTAPKGGSKKAAAPVKFFALAPAMRPSHGPALFAHTHAALTALGMLTPTRLAAPVDTLVAMIGKRAIKHHTDQGNLEGGERKRLTTVGYAAFKARADEGKFDPALAEAYLSMFKAGTVPPKATENAIRSIA